MLPLPFSISRRIASRMPRVHHEKSVYVASPTSDRFDPQLLAVFAAHRRRWQDGLIRLDDYCQQVFTDAAGNTRRLWYAPPLGSKIVIDKATFFESVGYRPGEPACIAHASLAKVRVFSGGARAGKSLWGGMELAPILLTPGTQSWIVAPKFQSGEKEFRYLLQHTVEHPAIRPMIERYIVRKTCRPDQGDMEVCLDFGDAGRSWVRVKSAVDPDSLLSEELDAVLICEASEIAPDRWSRYLKMRLATRQGIALIPTSPHGMGWVADLYRQGIDGEPGHFAVNVDSRMNPTISPEEVEFWARSMSDEDFDEQVRGRPAPKSGRVYPGFDRALHVDTWQPEWPKPTWKRYRWIDFGYSDPFVVLWAAEDEDRRLYIYREFYRTKQLPDDVVRYVAQVERWDTERDPETTHVKLLGERGKREAISLSICDWDASGRAALQRGGVRTKKAVKDVIDGVRSVAEALRLRDDGRPRLYVHPSCRNLLREIDSYEWDSRSELPKRDQDDHAMDALRYGVHTLAPRSRDMKVRSLTFGG